MRSTQWVWNDGPFIDAEYPDEPVYFTSHYLPEDEIYTAMFEHLTSFVEHLAFGQPRGDWTTCHVSEDGIRFRVFTCLRLRIVWVDLVSPVC